MEKQRSEEAKEKTGEAEKQRTSKNYKSREAGKSRNTQLEKQKNRKAGTHIYIKKMPQTENIIPPKNNPPILYNIRQYIIYT